MITLQERVHGHPPPEVWQLSKLHHVLKVRKGFKNTGMKEENLLSLSYGKIIQKDIDASEGLLPESFETYQIVEPGNIVMRLTDLQNDKRSLRQGLVRERGIVTSAYDALQVAEGHDPRFWAYALLALDLAKYYYSLGGGVRQSIKFADFPNDWLRAPDLETQKAIADFLDRETSRIDQLIEKKRLLLETLAERRSACLQIAVSGGRAVGEASLATRSVWFPSIPDTWRVARLKDVCLKISDGPHISPEYVDDGIPFISARNVKVDRWQLDDAKYISRELFDDLSRKSRPQIGDVLYTKGGTTGVARAVDLDFEFHIWVHVALLKLRPHLIDPYYLAYALNSLGCYEQSQLYTRGATNNDLGLNRMALIEFPLPTLAEQQRIVATLNEQTRRIDALREKITVSLSRLESLRVALITRAVTGEMDVVTGENRQIQSHAHESTVPVLRETKSKAHP